MGVDILNYSGVIASIDEMLGFVNGKNRKKIIEICQNFYDNLAKEASGKEANEWNSQRVEFFKALNKIEATTVDELKGILSSVVVVEGEPAKYDIDTHVEYSEELKDLWTDIILTFDKPLPGFNGISAFGSSRYNGYDVPLGEACFIFDDDDCYTKQLSEAGKNLKKILGHCNVTDWTVYSC